MSDNKLTLEDLMSGRENSEQFSFRELNEMSESIEEIPEACLTASRTGKYHDQRDASPFFVVHFALGWVEGRSWAVEHIGGEVDERVEAAARRVTKQLLMFVYFLGAATCFISYWLVSFLFWLFGG